MKKAENKRLWWRIPVLMLAVLFAFAACSADDGADIYGNPGTPGKPGVGGDDTSGTSGTVTVTGVSLKSSTSIVVGGTETLVAAITPTNATNRNVTWSSTNASVASVSTGGVVTGVSAGTATIIVATKDGGYQAMCNVTVSNFSVSVTSVSLKASVSLFIGDTEPLTAEITPDNATNQSVTWDSSNAAVASVSESGVVTAVSAGTANITVTTDDGGHQAVCAVTVSPIVVTSVSLNKSSTYIVKGGTETLFAIIEPFNATNQNVSWNSNNTAVATVSADGEVTAVTAGTATITVTTVDGGHHAVCTVTVSNYAVSVTGVSLKPTAALVVGNNEELTAAIEPYNATNQNITWNSSNPTVATVSESGVVTAIKVGTAIITVTTEDGNKTASCTVTVNPIVITFVVDAISTHTYTGSAIQPDVTVRDGAKALTKNTDYTVAYTNNINAGTATVTITGVGNYAGSSGSGPITFTINPKVITFTVDQIQAQPHTGSAISPAVTVNDGSKVLTPGTDYTVVYTNNINAGTATVNITGAGNYIGSSGSGTFAINATPTAADFDISGTTVSFDGNPKTVTITPKEGKTNGTITVKYNGGTTAPSAIGTYTVTFDVAAATGFSAASGLSAGTLTITPFTSISALDTYLKGRPANTATTPYIIELKVSSLGGSSNTTGSLGYILRNNSTKYVSLDLSGSTFTSIVNNAFDGCTRLTSVTIPNSVTSIEVNAFYGCTGLTSVTIGNSVTSIGNYAFYGCTGLTAINVDSSNANYSSEQGILYNKTKTTLIAYPSVTGAFTIPSNVTSIGDAAFSGCTRLTSVTIGNSVTSIGGSAFSNCTGLTGTLTIPNSVTSIGEYAFYGCTGLTSVTIGNSVTSIGNYAFYGCTGLTGTLTIPNSVTSIGYYAFQNCAKLTNVTFTATSKITSIGDFAFSGCTGLTGTLTIPNSVTVIRQSAFSGCTGLTGTLTIGNSVTSIGKQAFEGCTGLTSVTFAATSKVTSIGEDAFGGCTGLASVTIPNSVTSLSGFSGCTGLTSVTIPNSVTYIGSGAFENCTGLTGTLTIPNSVTYIGGSGAFYGCTGLTSVTIPNSVTSSIGNYAFYGCTSLTSVTIGNSVTSIGNYAFYGCTSLTSVTFAATSKVTSIGDYAFNRCTGLTGITIPNSVTKIGQLAFYQCTSLASVTIPDSVTSIGSQAFDYCNSLTSVTIPNSVTSIGSSAFRYCTSLTSVTFATGSNITGSSFGDFAFPEGSSGSGGSTLKTAYSTGKAGTYTRAANGSTWTKQ